MKLLIGIVGLSTLSIQAVAQPTDEPDSGSGFGNNRTSKVGLNQTGQGVTLKGRISGSRGGAWTEDGKRPGSGNAARSATGDSISSAAADVAAAAAFAACVAAGQVELTAGRPAPTCGFIPDPTGGPAAPGPPPAPAIDPGVLARQALLQLPIPQPKAQVGPPPSINEWNMAAVGYPLWLWTDDPNTHTTTVTEQGIALTLQATRRTTRFDLGDGARVFCGLTTPWHRSVEPGTPSPSCGHTYRQPSPAGQTYPITATTVWDITWTALGQTGTLELERTGPVTPLPVGELHALRTG